MHGQFVRELSEKVDKDKTWQWLSKSDLEIETEALSSAPEEQVRGCEKLAHKEYI